MAFTHEERSHSAARPHKMWPGFGGYEEHGGVFRRDSLPPDDADASAPGIALGHRSCPVGRGSQFMKHNVIGKGRCAAVYRAASSDRRERP